MGLISTWLKGIGIGYASAAFKKAGITSPTTLANVTLNSYDSLGITDVNDRKKLFYLIQRIKMAVNESNSPPTGNVENTDADADADADVDNADADAEAEADIEADTDVGAARILNYDVNGNEHDEHHDIKSRDDADDAGDFVVIQEQEQQPQQKPEPKLKPKPNSTRRIQSPKSYTRYSDSVKTQTRTTKTKQRLVAPDSPNSSSQKKTQIPPPHYPPSHPPTTTTKNNIHFEIGITNINLNDINNDPNYANEIAKLTTSPVRQQPNHKNKLTNLHNINSHRNSITTYPSSTAKETLVSTENAINLAESTMNPPPPSTAVSASYVQSISQSNQNDWDNLVEIAREIVTTKIEPTPNFLDPSEDEDMRIRVVVRKVGGCSE